MKGILWVAIPNKGEGDVKYNNIPHSHVTLQFGVELTPELRGLIGKKTSVKVIADCWSDRIQAYKVALESDVVGMCRNAIPHMTLSFQDGVKPVESNAMLSADHSESPLDIEVEGVIEFKPF